MGFSSETSILDSGWCESVRTCPQENTSFHPPRFTKWCTSLCGSRTTLPHVHPDRTITDRWSSLARLYCCLPSQKLPASLPLKIGVVSNSHFFWGASFQFHGVYVVFVVLFMCVCVWGGGNTTTPWDAWGCFYCQNWSQQYYEFVQVTIPISWGSTTMLTLE